MYLLVRGIGACLFRLSCLYSLYVAEQPAPALDGSVLLTRRQGKANHPQTHCHSYHDVTLWPFILKHKEYGTDKKCGQNLLVLPLHTGV